MKKLTRLKKVSVEVVYKRRLDADLKRMDTDLVSYIKRIDSDLVAAKKTDSSLISTIKRIDSDLTATNRSQASYGDIASKQNELFRQAVTEIKDELHGVSIETHLGQEQLDKLRSELSKTSLDLMKVVGATQDLTEDEHDLSSHATSLYALIENLKDEFHNLEKLVMSRTQRFLTGPVSRGGGGAVSIYNDEELLTKQAECIKFVGEDVLAVIDPNNPKCVLVYVPPPAFMIIYFTVNPNLIEVGIVVTDVVLEWDYSIPDVIEQVLTGPGTYPAVTDQARTESPTGLSEDRLKLTWNIKGKDPLTGLTDNQDVSLLFGALAFYGKFDTIPVNETEIESLANSYLGTGKTSGLLMEISPDPDYMIFSYPAAWGALGTVIDPQTGFEIPVQEAAQVTVENAYGYITMYRVYNSFQKTAGAFTWSFAGNSGIQLPPSL